MARSCRRAPAFASFLGHRILAELDTVGRCTRAIADFISRARVSRRHARFVRWTSTTSSLPALMARQRIDRDVANDTVQQPRRACRRQQPLAYSGTGDLRGWLRVSALRAAIRAQRKQALAVSEDAALADAALDVNLQYQRRLYETEFRAAFGEALANLTPRQRNLLKHSILHGANSDDLGALYQVHRATAARWLADARDELAADTQRRMIAKLAIDRADYDSILRLIHSQLDLSVDRLLRTPTVE
jgi:RNA polymerase sigma-70 factor (ECF subfamily)